MTYHDYDEHYDDPYHDDEYYESELQCPICGFAWYADDIDAICPMCVFQGVLFYHHLGAAPREAVDAYILESGCSPSEVSYALWEMTTHMSSISKSPGYVREFTVAADWIAAEVAWGKRKRSCTNGDSRHDR